MSKVPDKSAAESRQSNAGPAATRDLPSPDRTGTDENRKDFDSVILPASLSGGQQPAERKAEDPQEAAEAASVHEETDAQILPSSLVRAVALNEIGPEHFRRTLIAQSRRSATPGSPVAARAALRTAAVDSCPVEARLDDQRLVMLNDPDAPRAAAFRVLRHRLADHGDPRTIVVSSAEDGDGKTTCAVNLAIALSECGRARVLLLEADFRRPALAKALGMKPPRCLTEQMTEHHQRQEAGPWVPAQVTSPWLHVLAIDSDTFSGPRLVDGLAFENTVSQLKQVGYDYIVIDTSSVLVSADVNLVQDVADGVLLAVRVHRSTVGALSLAIDRLTPAKVLGVALLDT